MHPNDPYALTGSPVTNATAILGALNPEQRVLAVAMTLCAAGFEKELRTAVFQVSGQQEG